MNFRVTLAMAAFAGLVMLVGCAQERAAVQGKIDQAGDQVRQEAQAAGDAVKQEVAAAGDAVKQEVTAAGDAVKQEVAAAGDKIQQGVDRTRETASEFANINAVTLALQNAGLTEAQGASIKVEGNDKRVVLTGTVADASMKEKAQIAAREALDTLQSKAEIDNQIRVR